MKRKRTPCIPLDLLKETTLLFPDAWRQMEDFHRDNGNNGLPSWEPWCYAPMAAAMAIASHGDSDRDVLLASISFAQRIAALAPWRLDKEYYVMDPDMESLLYEQVDDVELSPEVFLHLPHLCFYVETSRLFLESLRVVGFFVHLEHDVNSGDRELRLLYVFEDGEIGAQAIHIDFPTISESFQRTRAEAFENISKHSPELSRSLLAPVNVFPALYAFLSKMTQLVLYILSTNAEITPVAGSSLVLDEKAPVLDKYTEIKKWDVGVRIGTALRKAKKDEKNRVGKESTSSTATRHASPRVHTRRGHWHHFWTGPHNDARNRILVLKWIAPTIVGLSEEQETPVVIHKVTKD